MKASTFAKIARRMDADSGIAPWQFAPANPGYV
jgi:hypothetical protein